MGYVPAYRWLESREGRWGRWSTRVVSGNTDGRLPGEEPDEGEPHVRFGEGALATERDPW